MPPKYLRDLLAANELAKSKPKRPVAKVSWEDQVRSKPRYTRSVKSTGAPSRVISKDNYSSFADSPLIRDVLPTTSFEEDELQKRRNPLYCPKRLSSDSGARFQQCLLRHQAAWQQAHPTREEREQARALAKLRAQDASPIDLRPFESNRFDQ